MTHLYKGAYQAGGEGHQAFIKTACGLRKPWSGSKLQPDVTESIGAVTCPECRAAHNRLSKGDFSGQEGKKAQ